MNYPIFVAELTDDPLERGYAGMTNREAADRLNVIDRTKNRESMSGSEILNAIDDTEWLALSESARQVVWDICHLGSVNPFGHEARLMQQVFSEPNSPTIAALGTARKEKISRANELGLDVVTDGHVHSARLKMGV